MANLGESAEKKNYYDITRKIVLETKTWVYYFRGEKFWESKYRYNFAIIDDTGTPYFSKDIIPMFQWVNKGYILYLIGDK